MDINNYCCIAVDEHNKVNSQNDTNRNIEISELYKAQKEDRQTAYYLTLKQLNNIICQEAKLQCEQTLHVALVLKFTTSSTPTPVEPA